MVQVVLQEQVEQMAHQVLLVLAVQVVQQELQEHQEQMVHQELLEQMEALDLVV
jgi:hypothetical protein